MKSFIFLLSLSISNFAWAQITVPKQNGAYPKQETEWIHPILDFLPADKGIRKAEREYTSEGRYKLCKYYQAESDLVQTYSYEYEDANQQSKCYWLKNEGQRILEYLESYTPEGKLLRRFRFRSDGKLLDSLVCQYDEQQRVIAEQLYNPKGEMVFQTAYQYDDEFHTAIEYHEDKTAKTRYEVGVKNNEQGLPLTRKRYNADGTLVDKTEFIRNEQGQLIEKRYYRDGRTLDTRETYDYLPQQKKAIWAVYIQGGAQLVEYTVFEYKY